MDARFTSIAILLLLAACGRADQPTDPAADLDRPGDPASGALRIAAVDFSVANLADEPDLTKYARADLVALNPWSFWQNESQTGALDALRAENPRMKILAYFSPKIVRQDWAVGPREFHPYEYDLYQAAAPYLCRTTTGDSLMDFPGAIVFDFTRAELRQQLLDVFVANQGRYGNRFDGIFWDYFAPRLWIAPDVSGMTGEPDMDGDSVPHWEDEDELAAFAAAQVAWVRETRARFGEDFIQVANGTRAMFEPEFATLFDGLYQERFPRIPYGAGGEFLEALDPSRPNSVWAMVGHLRTRNGGPWFIPTNHSNVGTVVDQHGEFRRVNPDDFNRVLALLTGSTSAHFDLSGHHRAGLPVVELDLGEPTAPTAINGGIMTREFSRGTIRLQMGEGSYPIPFRYWIRDAEGRNVQVFDPPYVYP